MATNFEGYIIKENNKQTDHYIKVKELIESRKKHDCLDTFYIVDEEDDVYECWGMDVFKITLKDIEALKNGKQLYFLESDGEYAGVIYLEEE